MKRLSLILSLLLVFILVSGFTGGTFLTVMTTELGKQTIYIDAAYKDSFMLSDGGLPILNRTSSITGYTLDSSARTVYRITIASYGDQWQYRLASGTTTTRDLHITAFDRETSNIQIAGLDLPESTFLLYFLIFALAAIIIVLWFKR